MRLAFKAQSQCRSTWEAIAEIKNPRQVSFARQANIAHGPQQVNNGPIAADPSRPRENEITPNKLLEEQDGERLDTGATSAAGSANQELEALGAIHGTAHARGQGQD